MSYTTNEKNFQRFIKEGIDKYETAIQSHSPKNQIRHANKCINKMNNALKLSELIEVKDKNGYIYEYITLSHTLIGEAYERQKDLQSAIHQFNLAKKHNKNTLKNEETYIRACFIESKLLDIALLQQSWDIVDNISKNILRLIKKIMDVGRRIKYLQIVVSSFMASKNISLLKKSYKKLIKEVDSLDGNDIQVKTTKALIYLDYGEFLKKVLSKKSKGVNYLNQAKEVFAELRMISHIDKVNKILNENQKK